MRLECGVVVAVGGIGGVVVGITEHAKSEEDRTPSDGTHESDANTFPTRF